MRLFREWTLAREGATLVNIRCQMSDAAYRSSSIVSISHSAVVVTPHNALVFVGISVFSFMVVAMHLA